MEMQFEDTLIELWHENPCLYDVSLPSFSNRLEKRKALENLGAKLNLSADTVLKRLTSFRTQYARISRSSNWFLEILK